MKKTISILMSILMLMSTMCIWATATNTSNTTYTYETEEAVYTVEFNDNNLTAEEQKLVAAKLAGIEYNTAAPANIWCDIFGHDYKYTTASVIAHKTRTYAPRCKRQTYDVTYCEDCDYTEQTLLTTAFIYCCPED